MRSSDHPWTIPNRRLRPEFLSISGSVTEPARGAVAPRDYERRLPKIIAPGLALIGALTLSLLLWAGIWVLAAVLLP